MKVYDKEIIQQNHTMLNQVVEGIEKDIFYACVKLPTLYFASLESNKDLLYLLHNSSKDNPLAILKASRKIADILTSNEYIQGVDIYYYQDNMIFTDTNVNYLDDDNRRSKPEWLIYAMENKGRLFWKYSHEKRMAHSDPYISYIVKIPFTVEEKDPLAYMAIHIYESDLGLYIRERFKGDNIFSIIDDEGRIIACNGDKDFIQTIMDKKTNKRLQELGSDDVVRKKIHKANYILSRASSNIHDWNYVMISPKSSLYKASLHMKIWLLIMGGFILLVNIIVAIGFTQKAQVPLKSMIQTVNDLSNLSNHDGMENECKWLLATFRNLTTKVEDLNMELEENKPIIRHTTINHLLKGKHRQGTLLDGEFLDINLHRSHICSFIIQIKTEEDISYTNKMLVDYNLISALENIQSDDRICIRAISMDENIIAGFLNCDDSISMNKTIQDMRETITGLLTITYCLYIGKLYSMELSNIAISYREAQECTKYSFIMPHETLIQYDTLHVNERKNKGSGHKILMRIQEYLRSSNVDALHYDIKSIIESIKMGQYKVEYAQNMLRDIISTIQNTMGEMGYSTYEIIGYNIQEHYEHIEDINEFDKWINQVIEVLIEKVNEKRQGYNMEMREAIQTYIEQNIYNDICLDTVADHFNMRSDTMSKCIKELLGITFSAYIKELKMKQAIILVSENKLTITDIAAKLGYNATPYFIKIFKQQTGYTPKQYQMKESFNKSSDKE